MSFAMKEAFIIPNSSQFMQRELSLYQIVSYIYLFVRIILVYVFFKNFLFQSSRGSGVKRNITYAGSLKLSFSLKANYKINEYNCLKC